MYCGRPTDLPLPKTSLFDDMEGAPMSVQQAYAEMIGTEDLTHEKYQVRCERTCFRAPLTLLLQVYAYLKRLGYVVTRTKPPSTDYPILPPFERKELSIPILDRLYSAATSFICRLARMFVGNRNWWKPIQLHHSMGNGEHPLTRTQWSLLKVLQRLCSSHYASYPRVIAPHYKSRGSPAHHHPPTRFSSTSTSPPRLSKRQRHLHQISPSWL